MILQTPSTGVITANSHAHRSIAAAGPSSGSGSGSGRVNHFHRPPRPRPRSISRSSSSPSPPPTHSLRSYDPSSSTGSHANGNVKDRRRSSSSRPGPATASSSATTTKLNGKSHLRISIERDHYDSHRLNGNGQLTPPIDRARPKSRSPGPSHLALAEGHHSRKNGSTSPSSPVSTIDGFDTGFSTQHSYGASASSPGGGSGSEKGMDRFVSASGEMTETEGVDSQRGQALLSARTRNGQAGISGGGGLSLNDFDPRLSNNGMTSPPPTNASGSKQSTFSRRVHGQLHHAIPFARSVLPIRLGSSRPGPVSSNADRKGQGKALQNVGYNLTRRRCEDGLVLGAVVLGIYRLSHKWKEMALAGEIGLLVGLSVIYTAFRARRVCAAQQPGTLAHSPRPASPSFSTIPTNAHPHAQNHVRERHPRNSLNHFAQHVNAATGREEPRGKNLMHGITVDEGDTIVGGNGCVWGTEEREYRECLNDGVFFALLLGPLLASAMLDASLTKLSSNPISAISQGWNIEAPMVLPSTPVRWLSDTDMRFEPSDAIKALSALATSRRNLVQLFTLCSFVLLVQLGWSLRLEIRLAKLASISPPRVSGDIALERENSDQIRGLGSAEVAGGRGTHWLRKGKWKRNLSAVGLGFAVTAGCVVVKIVTAFIGHGVWSDMSPSDIVIATLFYQFSLYVCVRLARRGFTLGELAVVCSAATALFMETVNLTRMKIRILRTPYIKTYRLPTPILIFQLALIPGSLLAGFLLSPLLYLSRLLAQRPARRLRLPHEKPIHRRLLALGFYAGAALVCGGLVGTWTQWCLGWRNPFTWIVYWLVEGRRAWTRPALIFYWGLLAAISVAGWNRQIVRGRRHRRYVVPGTREVTSSANGTAHGGPNGSTHSPSMPEGLSGVATQMMDAADQKMPILSVNSRRKFFHALAVVMFVPGIAIDPAFTHLSFSVAFAAFNFAEYIRYFALWPFGVSVHLFLNEFLDAKDSGTAILSHFYLLTGCAAPLWLEGPSEIMHHFGVISLGIGDAMASIVGRRWGRLRWSRASSKTVEGSVAFFASVLASSGLLWAFGLVDDFNVSAYVAATALATLLEAFSAQNDNLILPMYGWAVGTLLGV